MRYVLDFLDQTLDNDIQAYLDQNSITVIKTFDSLGKIYLVEAADSPPETHIVEKVTPDQVFDLNLDQVEYATVPVNDDNWWKIVSYTGSDVNLDTEVLDIPMNPAVYDVYLVDSGVDHAHPEFAGQTITDLFTVTPGDYADTNGHGTALASLITGNTCAISRANVHNVKIVDSQVRLSLGDLMSALDAIKKDSDSKPSVPAVANFSWTIPYNEYVNTRVQQLSDSGIAIVVAAGNQGAPLSDASPASVERVYTVGAYTQDFVPADFSNYTAGPMMMGSGRSGIIDVWAPGVDIRVAELSGGYRVAQGTSLSAAIFTACVCYNMSRREGAFCEVFGITLDKKMAEEHLHKSVSGLRENILDLTQQYSNSRNLIASFSDQGNPAYRERWNRNRGFTITERYRISDPDTVWIPLYYPLDVESVTSDNLPAGLQITDGWLGGSLPVVDHQEVFRKYEFTVTLTSYDQTETTINMMLIQLSDNDLTVEDIPEDMRDQDLDITLQFGPCWGGSLPPCFNDCNAPAPLCEQPSPKISCICVN